MTLLREDRKRSSLAKKGALLLLAGVLTLGTIAGCGSSKKNYSDYPDMDGIQVVSKTENYSDYVDLPSYTGLELEATEETEAMSEAWEIIYQGATVKSLPSSLIDMYEEYFENSISDYFESVENYISQAGISEAVFNNQKQSFAVEQAKFTTIVEAICKEIGITEDSEEYKAQLEEFVENNGMTEEEAIEQYGEIFFTSTIKFNTVMQYVYDHAQ